MLFSDLSNEARQRLIDVQQRGEALRAIEGDLRRRFAGSMAWKPRDGRDYLYKRNGPVEKSLGVKSPETEEMYRAFTTGKAAAEQRRQGLRRTLQGMARVNKAMGLGRVPSLVGRILRRLDAAGVLGEQVCVVGTNALFAYEAKAGVRFQTDLLATSDIDIALDARRNLELAGRAMPEGLLGVLRKIDPSFAPQTAGHFTAVNADGLMVDLITPEPKQRMKTSLARMRRLGAQTQDLAAVEDVEAVEVPRLEMIVDAPRFSAIAVADDGLPVWISAADPRWWAAHKFWLGDEPKREAIKRQRDRSQGQAVAQMLAGPLSGLDFSDATLASIPTKLRENLRQEVDAATKGPKPAPEW